MTSQSTSLKLDLFVSEASENFAAKTAVDQADSLAQHDPATRVALPDFSQSLTDTHSEDLGFTGTFGDVVRHIDSEIEVSVSPELILSTARLVRAIIDHKAIDSQESMIFDAVLAVTNLALDIFRRAVTRAQLHEFLTANESYLPPSSSPVSQREDIVTYFATQPDKIDKASAKVAQIAGDEDVLFLSLCHGGFIAGAGTYLTREYGRPDGNSLFYPVRFSRIKHQDTFPQLTIEERLRLTQEAARRRVIIFDEDVSSGSTMQGAMAYFGKLFGRAVDSLTTYNSVEEIHKQKSLKHAKELGALCRSSLCNSPIVPVVQDYKTIAPPYANDKFNILSQPLTMQEDKLNSKTYAGYLNIKNSENYI